MAEWRPYSKRQNADHGREAYRYEELPPELRTQIMLVLKGCIGKSTTFGWPDGWTETRSFSIWRMITNKLLREHGILSLPTKESLEDELSTYVMEADTDRVLDVVEISFRIMDKEVRKLKPAEKDALGVEQTPDEGISELNRYFEEHGVGYEYDHGLIRRRDSQYIHKEIVKPAVSLLYAQGFAGPQEEFDRAHQHYRHQRYSEAITEACKAFESTMKAICEVRKWTYAKDAPASKVIKTVMDNGLIPAELQTEFNSLSSLLESGLPTVRNKKGGHGQGKDLIPVPKYLSAFTLHLAATNIVFLIEAHQAL